MAYDFQGNLVETWQPVGSQTDYAYYAYDRLNRQVASVTPAPNTTPNTTGAPAVVAATQYDTFGEVVATWSVSVRRRPSSPDLRDLS